MFWCGGECCLVCEVGEYVGAVFLDPVAHAFG